MEERAAHTIDRKWLEDLKTAHSNFPEQEPVMIAEAHIHEKSLKNDEQMNQLLKNGTHPER